MAITQAIAYSFKQELLTGTHNFTTTTGDVFKIALYTSAATLSGTTTAYTATGESSGTGYTAGGKTLTSVTPVVASGVAYTDFADVTWSASTVTARGAMVYNSSKSNKAVIILDFGSDKSSTAGDFSIIFPSADLSNAIIRIA